MIDTRSCKFCGTEFSKVSFGRAAGDIDGVFDEGYCSKFCRKDHEKQQIKEGLIEPIEKFGSVGVLVDNSIRDVHGEPIWMPKVGGYHDPALGVYFESKKQKQQYLKEKGFCMQGASDPKTLPIEAGDKRQRSNRLN